MREGTTLQVTLIADTYMNYRIPSQGQPSPLIVRFKYLSDLMTPPLVCWARKEQVPTAELCEFKAIAPCKFVIHASLKNPNFKENEPFIYLSFFSKEDGSLIDVSHRFVEPTVRVSVRQLTSEREEDRQSQLWEQAEKADIPLFYKQP